MRTSRRSVWVGSALAALLLGFFAPLATARPAASGADGASLCAGPAAIAGLESQARSAAASGDGRQYELWMAAADAAARCAQSAGDDARGWYAYLNASDEFLALPGEAQIVSGAPAILAELDALLETEKKSSVLQAARVLRDDIALAYRQTRAIVAARATPVPTPEPTLSPILLRGRGPLGRNF